MIRVSRRALGTPLLLGFLAGACLQGRLGAQDVELLARIHGTRPPRGYYDVMRRDPGAFQFKRALIRRGLRMREIPDRRRGGAALTGAYQAAFEEAMVAGPERASVTGSFQFPLILGRFSDGPPPAPEFSRDLVQQEFWDGPQANPSAVGTIPDYYAEVSGGRVTLGGTTFDWVQTPLSEMDVAAGQYGLGPGSRVGEFIVRILESVDDGSVDWGQFDNDGPDGVPNSGDDDGYVDILAVMHPNSGESARLPFPTTSGPTIGTSPTPHGGIKPIGELRGRRRLEKRFWPTTGSSLKPRLSAPGSISSRSTTSPSSRCNGADGKGSTISECSPTSWGTDSGSRIFMSPAARHTRESGTGGSWGPGRGGVIRERPLDPVT